MNNGITKENLLRLLPPALSGDQSIMALAEAGAAMLEARLDEIDHARVISNIDALPEAVLDILARDFKVDWWDSEYSLEEKRATLKDSWRIHRTMGTKAAVLKAISAIYADTKLLEWFEYGGQPYHFLLLIDSTYENVDPEKHRRVMEKVEYYKPLRAVMDETEYYDAGAVATMYAGAAFAGAELSDSGTAVRY